MQEKKLIVIVGPTGIGKTSLSIDVARELNCEIISADSRQFYNEMTIGTAKPTNEELDLAVHHFINCNSIHEEYSAGKFELDALILLKELFKKRDVVIMVGGSGMYIDAVCNGIDAIPSNVEIRDQLNKEFKNKGIEPLQEELLRIDPEHYHRMDNKNPMRLIRALEVCRYTGKTYSSFRNNQVKKREFRIIKIGLTASRSLIYERINNRVDDMMKNGLVKEAKKLFSFKHLNALNTVGYKELFRHFNNEMPLNEAIEEIKKNTRRFAKRQLTWFKNDNSINWFELDNKHKIINYIKNEKY